MIYTLGDSHSGFSFSGIPNVRCHPISGGVTMTSVGRNEKGKGSEYLDLYISDRWIKPTDIIILCFGEIDVRSRIKPRIENGEDLKDIIDSIVSDFFKVVLGSTHSKFWMCSIPPTGRCDGVSLEYAYKGTDEERVGYTDRFNEILEDKCQELHIPFLDVYSTYKDSNGLLDVKKTIDGRHIRVTEGVASAVNKMLERYETDRK